MMKISPTAMPTATRRIRLRGFSLVELMVVLAIVGILLIVAVPGYSSYIRKSRRTEARTALLDLAGREERLFSTTNAYSTTPSALGYSGAAFPVIVGSGYYQVDVAAPAPAAGALPTFTITATAITSQAKDTSCATFAVDQTGAQSATGSATASVDCWK
jgi:type IV pilus assembly protein PilE